MNKNVLQGCAGLFLLQQGICCHPFLKHLSRYPRMHTLKSWIITIIWPWWIEELCSAVLTAKFKINLNVNPFKKRSVERSVLGGYSFVVSGRYNQFFRFLQCHYMKVQWTVAEYLSTQEFNIAINWCQKQAKSTWNRFFFFFKCSFAIWITSAKALLDFTFLQSVVYVGPGHGWCLVKCWNVLELEQLTGCEGAKGAFPAACHPKEYGESHSCLLF